MTVSTTTNRTELVGNGTVGPYTLTFPILANGDLKVYVGGTLRTLTTHYTVANAGSGSNATVTFTSSAYPSPGTSLSSSISLVFVRNVSNTQPSNYQNNDIFDAETLEQSLDRATMQIQQSGENIDRSIRFGDTATGIDASVTEIIAAANLRANKLISFDASGDIQVTQEIGTYKGNWATATVYVQRDLVKQSSTNDGSTKDNVYICVDAHTSTGTHLTQNDSAKWALILDVATASGGVTESSDWARKVDGIVVATSGGNDYSSKAYAIGGSGVDDGSGSAKDWASKASGNVGNTSTKSAKQYADDASTSASTATSQAGIATTKAGEASTSEGNALTYRNEAQTAKTAAETALDSFDDRYLGSKTVSSHPSLDNDGNSLLTGALYYNTGSGSISAGLYVYSGSAWESMEVSIGGNTVTSTSGNNLNLVTPSNSNKVVINSGDKTIQLPNVRASQANYVLAMSNTSTGETSWQVTATAPTISGVTGELNVYESSSSTEDGGVLTLTGTDFGTQEEIDSIKIMDSTEANKVTASAFTVNSTTNITVTFNGSETGYNSWGTGGLASTNWHIQVIKSGLGSNVFPSGKSFTQDPTIFSVTQTASGDNNGKLEFDGTGGIWGSYGGQTAGGGQDSNTKLLLNFDRSNGQDIEDSSNIGSTGHKVTPANAVIKSSPFGDGKSAMYFAGGTDRAVIANNADFSVGSSAWSLDYWVAPDTSTSGGIVCICGISGTDAASNNSALVTYIDGSHNLAWFMDDDSTDDWDISTGASGFTFPTNLQWHHIAVTYGGSSDQNYRLFVDGSLIKTVSTSATIYSTSGNQGLLLGTNQSSSAHFKGYLDEIRWVVGENPFPTTNFTPSQYRYGTTGATHEVSTASNMKVLIHSDQEDDVSDSKHSITKDGGAIQKTDQSKWGGSSWYFDGSDARLEANASSDFNLAQNSCVEFWFRPSSTSNFQIIVSHGGAIASGTEVNGWAIFFHSNVIKVRVRDTSNNNHELEGSTSLSTNTWYHVAWTRNGTVGKLYIDGALESNTETDSGGLAVTTNSTNKPLRIGTAHDNSHEYTGYVDDLRIVNGATVYTGAFSKPTGPLTTTGGTYPNSNNRTDPTASQTKLLIHGDGAKFTDSATSGTTHTITPTGAYHTQSHGGIAPAMTFPASGKLTGSAGVYFDGDGDNLTITTPSGSGLHSTLGSANNWFWEGWIYYIDAGSDADRVIFSSRSSNVVTALVAYFDENDDRLHFVCGGSSSWYVDAYASGTEAEFRNKWGHLLIQRNGANLEVYVNGKKKALTGTNDMGSNSLDVGTTMTLADDSAGNSDFKGYIDCVRIGAGTPTSVSGDPLFTNGQTSTDSNNYVSGLPTKIYGAPGPDNPSIGSIEIVTATDDDVNVTYSFQGSTEDNASVLGTSSDLAIASDTTGANKKKGTLTGTLQGNPGSVTNLRIQAKANNDSNRLVEVNETSGVGAIRLDKAKTGKPVLFNVRRYFGSGADRDINGFGFQPDFCWIKSRGEARSHYVWDSVTNLGDSPILPNTNAASVATAQGHISKFNQDGFSLTHAGTSLNVNNQYHNFVAFAWKAGGAPSGTLGTINSSNPSGAGTITNTGNVTAITQSVDQNSGLSITKYTGGATGASQTSAIPHNLGGTPHFIIVKNLDGAYDWVVYHNALSNDKNLNLNNATDEDTKVRGFIDQPDGTNINLNSSTAEVSSKYGRAVNANGDNFICFAFKAMPGVSAIGSYVSSSGGTRVYTTHNGNASDAGVSPGTNGFRPKFIMTKAINYNSSYAGWTIIDGSRVDFGSNSSGDSFAKSETLPLFANQNYAEGKRGDDSSDVSEVAVDIFDDGFKFDGANNPESNGFGSTPSATHIYIAFA